jgi:hypothetical protein
MYFLYKNGYRIFEPVERGERKEKNRGDKPIRVVIHIYMEVSQGNSLYSYLFFFLLP